MQPKRGCLDCEANVEFYGTQADACDICRQEDLRDDYMEITDAGPAGDTLLKATLGMENQGFKYFIMKEFQTDDHLGDLVDLAQEDGSWFEQLYGNMEHMTASYVWANYYAEERRPAINHLIKTEGHPFYLKFKHVWFEEFEKAREKRVY